MSNGRDRSDVVVVGGGLAGLAAAAYLGRAGLSVRVVERASAPGGRAATTREQGFALNRGPHALYRGGEAQAVLSDLGVPAPGRTVPSGGRAFRNGALHQLPVGAMSLLTTGLFGWGAKATTARLLERLPRMDPDELGDRSVAEWLDGLAAGAEARELLEAVVRVSTYTNAPRTFSAKTALLQVQRALGGVRYIDGGWQTIVDGLGSRAASWGVQATSGRRATALGPDGSGGYEVGLADGSVIAARGVVLAVAPREAARLLSSAGATVPAAMQSPVPLRAATLDLALSRLGTPSERFVLGIDRPLYLSVHSTVANLAPAGGGLVHVLKYLSGDETDPDQDRAELEALLELSHPGWRSAVVHAQYLPRIVVAERLDLATDGGVSGRPTPEVPGLPGVVLAGDWVQGGSWLADASLGSARAAARALALWLEPARAVA
jgi:phytoene dehydrogenase-like protein